MMKLIAKPGERPLWSQLYDILCERIDAGVYPINGMLPAEKDLMNEFEVSRIVVRQAMDKLMMDGRVQRTRGKGTIVLEPVEKLSTSFVSSIHGLTESKNYKNRRVISFEKKMAPEEVYDYWNLEPQPIYCLVRCTYLKQKVVNRFETYLHPSVPLSQLSEVSDSLYEALKDRNYEVTQITDTITAGLIRPEDQEYFGLDEICAVVYRTRISYHQDQPIEYTYSTYLAEGYQLTIENG
ncbi:MAG: GntR family transcriptional regulator [Erysipelotrichaceae bacterium]|nr:GntR family transcriptional regulator [Erysipelotrichaceae bacterium]